MTKKMKNGELLARDIMTKKVFVLRSQMSVNEVTDFFLEHKFTSAPVLGSDGQVVGILDEFTLIRLKLNMHLIEDKRDKLSDYTDLLLPISTVRETEYMVEVMKLMLKAPNHRLFIVDSNNTICGIISPKDVLRYIEGAKKRGPEESRTELDKTKEELNQALMELKKTKNRLDIYQDIVMENPIMIHSVDRDGKIIMANKKMHEALGYNVGELIGKTLYDIYSEDMHKKAIDGLKKIIKYGEHKNTYTVMKRKNGDKIRVDVASAALYDDKRDFLATISVSRQVDSDALLRTLHGIVSGANR